MADINNVLEDWVWSDDHMQTVKAICGVHLIGTAALDEDQAHNTDLQVLAVRGLRIAVRVRRIDYARHTGQFTLRCIRPRGAKTELRKVLEGWGDFVFYGFEGAGLGGIGGWILGDLEVFRMWWAADLPHQYEVKFNADGSSAFAIFRLQDLPPEFLVASGHGLDFIFKKNEVKQ